MSSLRLIIIDNTMYFVQDFVIEDGFKTVTCLHLPSDLPEDKYLRIHHNPVSSLYDEENYGGKHLSKPPIYFCIWDLGKYIFDEDKEEYEVEWWTKRGLFD